MDEYGEVSVQYHRVRRAAEIRWIAGGFVEWCSHEATGR